MNIEFCSKNIASELEPCKVLPCPRYRSRRSAVIATAVISHSPFAASSIRLGGLRCSELTSSVRCAPQSQVFQESLKGLSLEESRGRAPEDFAIPAMRLPIDEHIPRSFQGRGHILNINTVAHILMAFQECGDWEEAIVQVMYAEAPARFRQSIQPERRALVDGSRPPPKVPLNTRNTRCFRPLLRDHVSGTACGRRPQEATCRALPAAGGLLPVPACTCLSLLTR